MTIRELSEYAKEHNIEDYDIWVVWYDEQSPTTIDFMKDLVNHDEKRVYL